jgi:hypothetical protein
LQYQAHVVTCFDLEERGRGKEEEETRGASRQMESTGGRDGGKDRWSTNGEEGRMRGGREGRKDGAGKTIEKEGGTQAVERGREGEGKREGARHRKGGRE